MTVTARLVDEARAILAGRAGRVPALDRREDRSVALAGFALAVAPAAAMAAPHVLGTETRLALGSGFGPVTLGAVVGGALGLHLVLRARRRGIGRRRIAWAAALLSVTSLLSCALSARPPTAAPLLGGMAFAAALACLPSLLADSVGADVRVRALCWHVRGLLLGVALVPMAAVLALGRGGNVRAAFLAIAVSSAVATVPALRRAAPEGAAVDEAEVRAVVRARLGDGADDHAGSTANADHRGIRRLTSAAAVRAAAPLALCLGFVLGPLPRAIDLLLRDRWVVPRESRVLALGVVLLGGALLLGAFARRSAMAWRAGPARLAHHLGWAAGAGAAALALTASASSLAVAGVLLSVAVGTTFGLLLGGLVLGYAVVDPPLRSHLGGLVAVAMLVGSVVGDVIVSSIGSRFGAGWAMAALAAAFVGAGGRLVRGLPAFERDAVATATRIVESEELRLHRAAGRHLPLLSCRHIDFSYGQVQVLFDVSFSLDEGEMVALLGTNGAGKSTLLRVISGLGAPSRGSVHFDGRDITFDETDSRVRMGITQIPGGKAVFGSLSVVDNLRAYGYSCGRDRARVDAGIDATFEAFPRLGERRNQLASTLSGGEQQMLGLGKALILQPRLLLIDELSLGLAPIVVGELLAMVQRIHAGGTAIVLVEQSVNIALSLVDHAYFMEKGEVRFDGPADDLAARPDLLRSVFLAGATAAAR